MFTLGLRKNLENALINVVSAKAITLEELPEEGEVIVDAESVGQLQMTDIRERHPALKLTLVVDRTDATSQAIAAQHDWDLVLANRFLEHITNRQKVAQQPLIAMWGVLPQLGSSTIGLALAHELATNHGKTVGILGMNAYSTGSNVVPSCEKYLDDVRSDLLYRSLTPARLRNAVHEMEDGVCVLLGLKRQTDAYKFSPSEAQQLIRCARELFDVTILDLGAILNTSLAIEGMRDSTLRYCIMTDLLSAKSQWHTQIEQVWNSMRLHEHDFLAIGNKVRSVGNFQAFARDMGVSAVASIPYFHEYGYFAEAEGDPLRIFMTEKKFAHAIRDIAKGIAAQFQVTVQS